MIKAFYFDTIFDRQDLFPPGVKPPWLLSLERYLVGNSDISRVDVDERYARAAEEIAPLLPTLGKMTPANIYGMTRNTDLKLVETIERDRHINQPYLVVVTSSGQAVGAYLGGDLYVDPEYRNRGIGSELVLARAMLHDKGRHDGRCFTAAGLAAAKASHRLAAEQAYLRGEPMLEGHMDSYGLNDGRAPTP